MGADKGARFRAMAATDLAHTTNMEGIPLTMAGDPAYHGRPPSVVCAGGRGWRAGAVTGAREVAWAVAARSPCVPRWARGG
jgi:hypothetical protein